MLHRVPLIALEKSTEGSVRTMLFKKKAVVCPRIYVEARLLNQLTCTPDWASLTKFLVRFEGPRLIKCQTHRSIPRRLTWRCLARLISFCPRSKRPPEPRDMVLLRSCSRNPLQNYHWKSINQNKIDRLRKLMHCQCASFLPSFELPRFLQVSLIRRALINSITH